MSGPEILNRQRRYPIPITRLRRFANDLVGRLHVDDCQFTLVLTNDRTMRRLNRSFRHKDTATDILSFPAERHAKPSRARLANRYLGDMIVSVETARRQAFRRNHSLQRELCILMIHGLLHLMGYDHEVDRGQMHRKESWLQKELL
jgi:probable rRNA maturation factor